MEENPQVVPFSAPTFMSAQIDKIASALSKFQGALKQPKLNKEVKVATKTGGSYKFKYADLNECISSAKQPLCDNGLSVTQLVVNSVTQLGVNNVLETILLHSSGQWIKSSITLPKVGGSIQDFGSALTYIKRYSYCAILGLVADTDDDGNAYDGNTAEFQQPKKQVAFTGAQMKAVLERIDKLTDYTAYTDLWREVNAAYPAMCQKGTEVYTAFCTKGNELRNK